MLVINASGSLLSKTLIANTIFCNSSSEKRLGPEPPSSFTPKRTVPWLLFSGSKYASSGIFVNPN